MDQDTRELYQKAMAAFGGIAPSYHIELLDKPTIYWDFHSLLLGIQMMFSFMLVTRNIHCDCVRIARKHFWAVMSTPPFAVPSARTSTTSTRAGKSQR